MVDVGSQGCVGNVCPTQVPYPKFLMKVSDRGRSTPLVSLHGTWDFEARGDLRSNPSPKPPLDRNDSPPGKDDA